MTTYAFSPRYQATCLALAAEWSFSGCTNIPGRANAIIAAFNQALSGTLPNTTRAPLLFWDIIRSLKSTDPTIVKPAPFVVDTGLQVDKQYYGDGGTIATPPYVWGGVTIDWLEGVPGAIANPHATTSTDLSIWVRNDSSLIKTSRPVTKLSQLGFFTNTVDTLVKCTEAAAGNIARFYQTPGLIVQGTVDLYPLLYYFGRVYATETPLSIFPFIQAILNEVEKHVSTHNQFGQPSLSNFFRQGQTFLSPFVKGVIAAAFKPTTITEPARTGIILSTPSLTNLLDAYNLTYNTQYGVTVDIINWRDGANYVPLVSGDNFPETPTDEVMQTPDPHLLSTFVPDVAGFSTGTITRFRNYALLMPTVKGTPSRGSFSYWYLSAIQGYSTP